MQFKATAIIQRLKKQIERIEKAYRERLPQNCSKIERCLILNLLKTSQNLDRHYLLIDNLSVH